MAVRRLVGALVGVGRSLRAFRGARRARPEESPEQVAERRELLRQSLEQRRKDARRNLWWCWLPLLPLTTIVIGFVKSLMEYGGDWNRFIDVGSRVGGPAWLLVFGGGAVILFVLGATARWIAHSIRELREVSRTKEAEGF